MTSFKKNPNPDPKTQQMITHPLNVIKRSILKAVKAVLKKKNVMPINMSLIDLHCCFLFNSSGRRIPMSSE